MFFLLYKYTLLNDKSPASSDFVPDTMLAFKFNASYNFCNFTVK